MNWLLIFIPTIGLDYVFQCYPNVFGFVWDWIEIRFWLDSILIGFRWGSNRYKTLNPKKWFSKNSLSLYGSNFSPKLLFISPSLTLSVFCMYFWTWTLTRFTPTICPRFHLVLCFDWTLMYWWSMIYQTVLCSLGLFLVQIIFSYFKFCK